MSGRVLVAYIIIRICCLTVTQISFTALVVLLCVLLICKSLHVKMLIAV